ncbi:hypothetical protein Scep_021413 [Stephania cephalantha]|uniref:GED domain-containing protein n=1 Tax=Stephania cephalantha TaxID=152367 RepID=A0AAP0F4B2_9MAGN
MKMRVMAYRKIVMLRLVDNLVLHLLTSMKNLVNEEMEAEVFKELMGGNRALERLLEESTVVANKREKRKNPKMFLLK